ncbi:hypothetical protein [Clostridium gasigenes]|uniref:Uncharacterized protein n=1 Tax=Clostridium gasigenes TaxID=94869 RepID=A0A7X0SET2_9CLOT|nr:hypothetical protein [Clostridium gasigenes]MBB6716262.1 hypothetical protein [Clostridium gasigenes]
MGKSEIKDGKGRVVAIINDENIEAFKLDKKQHIFMLLFNEYEKDIPNFKELIKECNFDEKIFKTTVRKLINEELIGGIPIDKWTTCDGYYDISGTFITRQGYKYVAALNERYCKVARETLKPQEKELQDLKAYITKLEKDYEEFKKEYADCTANYSGIEEENSKLKDQVRGLRYSIKHIASLL